MRIPSPGFNRALSGSDSGYALGNKPTEPVQFDNSFRKIFSAGPLHGLEINGVARYQSQANMTTSPPVIHNVYFWLKNDISPEDRTRFEEELKRLAATSYLQAAFVGIPAATEERPVTDHTFHYSISFHFKSMKDHEFYQSACPDHARFVDQCKPLFENVRVLDVAPLD